MLPIDDWSPRALLRAYADGVPGDHAEWRWLTSAGAELHRRLDRLQEQIDAGEVAAFQAYLGRVVRTVNPLLLRLCKMERYELDVLVAALRPLSEWPDWLCGVSPQHRPQGIAGKRTSRRTPGQNAACRFEQIVHGGLVVQPWNHTGIPFGLRVLGSGLETAAMLGEHHVRTFGHQGSMTLRADLPATMVMGLHGEPLDRLVDHSLLAGAGCIITSVEKNDVWGTKVRFELDPVAWRVPWARSAKAPGRTDASGGARNAATPE